MLLLILFQVKEELFLSKILETKFEFGFKIKGENDSATKMDPLNVTKITGCSDGLLPELIFNRFIFQTIDVFVEKVVHVIKNEENDFVTKELTLFLIYCLYIFQSGIFNYAVF